MTVRPNNLHATYAPTEPIPAPTGAEHLVHPLLDDAPAKRQARWPLFVCGLGIMLSLAWAGILVWATALAIMHLI